MSLDLWLGASLDAGDVVSGWIDAVLVWISFFERSQLGLTEVQSSLPVDALWLASLHYQRLRVLPLSKHAHNGVCLNPGLPCEIIDILLYYLLRSV